MHFNAKCVFFDFQNWIAYIEKEMLEIFAGELTGVKDMTEHQAGDHSYY